MTILVTRLATAGASLQAEKHPKWKQIAISRGYVHFQQMLRQTKTKSKKFRIRWSKVPRVLEPLKSSYGHFSHTAGHGRFKPKNTQNGNKSRFPGATCFFSKWCERQNRRARNSASDGQKYRAFWSPQNRVMAILVTRRAMAISSRKTPKMERNRDFPGLRAFSANVVGDKIEEQEIPHPMVKSTARFGAPKIELWPLQSTGGPWPFQAEKHPKWQ